jgi:hypothetical protein
MKTLVKGIILLVALILLSGSAFAFCWPPQYGACYTVTANDQDNPENSCTREVVILFNFENECGILFAPPITPYPLSIMFLSMYFDPMNEKMSGGLLFYDTMSIKFHGDQGAVFTGELSSFFLPFCGGPNTEYYRYALRGLKLEEGCSDTLSNMSAIENLVQQTETMLNQTGTGLSDLKIQ